MTPENLIPATDFCSHHQVEVSFIQTLQDYGLIELKVVEGTGFINAEELTEVERLKRLHYDLQINMEGLDAVRNLLQQMQNIQQEIADLKARLRLYEAI
jgi:hypothetical protein